MTVAQRTALQTGVTDLTTANAAVQAAKNAYHAAVRDRAAKDVVCTKAAASVATTVYGSAATEAQISALGLSPRAKERTKVTPKTVVDLSAVPAVDGDVTLKWGRNGNATGVVFLVESQSGTGPWTFVQGTTRCRATLRGYAPGVTANFRVIASKNGVVANPSPVVPVYFVPLPPALRLAA